jgi:outer membrane protein assembly factor BamB
MWQSSDGGAQSVLSDPNRKQLMEPWKTHFLDARGGPAGMLFENSLNGTLATDGTRVLLVDDMMLPANPLDGWNRLDATGRRKFGTLTDQVYRNSLKAFNLESFKLVWELGGKFPSHDALLDVLLGVADKDGNALPSDAAGSYFLGPPLPLGGKLYALHERGRELRLLCLQARDRYDDKLPPPPDLVWAETLVKTRGQLDRDINRRIHAAHLAYSEGVFVCPTNAGALVAVDLLTHRPLWLHVYRELPPLVLDSPPPAGYGPDGRPLPFVSLTDEWKNSAPAIHDGKVIFALPDGRDLRCLDVHDGRLLWKVDRVEGDLYFAGVCNGKALVVGKNAVRAYHMDTGQVAWCLADTGLPSGQGVASGGIYYLPVEASAKDKTPEVLTIDVAKGAIVAHIAAKKDVPGNLIFHEGQLISQTLTGVTSYPLVKATAK